MSDWLHNWLTKRLSDEQLEELRAAVFDRWTWDTGGDADRRLFEALDQERDQRKIPAVGVTLTGFGAMQAGPGITLTDDGNGTITISVDEDAVIDSMAGRILNDTDEIVIRSVLDQIQDEEL